MGNGIRLRRRNTNMFVWAIYTVKMGVDESVYTEQTTFGSVNGSYLCSKNYTVQSDGTVKLSNPSTRTVKDAKGYYSVVVPGKSGTNETGDTLYYLKSPGQGNPYSTITYRIFTPSLCVKGTDTGERVSNAEMIYPENGVKDGVWYVLIGGKA